MNFGNIGYVMCLFYDFFYLFSSFFKESNHQLDFDDGLLFSLDFRFILVEFGARAEPFTFQTVQSICAGC